MQIEEMRTVRQRRNPASPPLCRALSSGRVRLGRLSFMRAVEVSAKEGGGSARKVQSPALTRSPTPETNGL